MKRPALIVSLCYVVGLLAGHYRLAPPGALGVGLVALCSAGVALLFCRSFPSRIAFFSGCLGLVFAGAFWYTVQIRVADAGDIRRHGDGPEQMEIEGRIIADPEFRDRYNLVTLDADSIRSVTDRRKTTATGRLIVRLYTKAFPGNFGDRVVVSGWLRRPSPSRNPGGFDARTYYESRSIYGLMSVSDTTRYSVRTSVRQSTFHTVLIFPLKRYIERAIESGLSGSSAALLKGVLLGQRQDLSEDILTTFSIIGLTHILSVSGLHVGLIAFIMTVFFSVLRLPRLPGAMATILALVLYAFLTDLTPPVVRASIMAGLFIIGRIMDRQTDAVNILGVAGLVILGLWPAALFDLGFQLSFIATLAILVGYPRLKENLPFGWDAAQQAPAGWIRDGLLVSLAAQIGTTPILAAAFFQLSWIAPFANLVIGPLVFVSTTLGALTALVAWISDALAFLFNAANGLVLTLMIALSERFASIPSASLPVPAPSLMMTVGFYAICLLFLWPPVLRRKRLLFGAAGLIIGVGVGWLTFRESQPLRVTVLDVGQGDAIFIECPNGRTILVDGGPRTPEYDAGAQVLLPFLRYRGYRKIDTVIMTHPHTDHYGGLLTLFNAFEIGETVTNGMRGEGRMFHQWEEIIRRRRIRHRVATAGDRIPGLGAISLTTLHPSVDFMNRVTDGNPNERSLVLRLDYGAFRLLLTGDIEDDGEAALIETGGDLRSVAIKVPHHGSRTSSGGGLIEVTRPEVALISVGKRNLFRHPSPEVIERYRARSAATRRTDMEGALTLTVRDRNWEVTPMLFPEDPTLLLTPSQALKSILLTGHLNGSILRRIT